MSPVRRGARTTLSGGKLEPRAGSTARERRARLDIAERRLRAALAEEAAIPFLGHHPLSTQEAIALGEELASGNLDLPRRLRGLFLNWQAVTAAWIAGCAAREYGSENLTELWPHLDRLFRGKLSGPDRRVLGKDFLDACRSLDLPVAAVDGIVDAFVHQAGVPETQVEAMLRAEQRLGLPDPDDDVGCEGFSTAAGELADPGLVRLRRILAHDANGAYARCWLQVRAGATDDGADPYTLKLRAALEARGPEASAGQRPALVWRDAMPCLRLPAGSGRRWTVELGSLRREVVGEAQGLLVPLPEAAGRAVAWRSGGQHAIEGTIRLLEDAREVLFFAGDAGRLIGRGQLEAAAAPPVRLPRGEIVAVARRAIRWEGLEAEPAAAPGLFALALDLGDEPLRLGGGAATLDVAPIQRPEIRLRGGTLPELDGRSVHLAQGLAACVRWPDRPRDGVPGGYALRFATPAGEQEIAIADPTAADVDLGPWLAELPPRLTALRLTLVRRGEQRALARAAGLVWVGITGFDGRRFHGRSPLNLDPAASVGLVDGGDGLAIAADPMLAAARLAFLDTDGRGRDETLAFAKPGMSARLIGVDAEGRRRPEPLPPGSSVVVRPGDTRLLEITCSDPGARLLLGSRDHGTRFASRPAISRPLTAIAEACRGTAAKVSLVGSEGVELEVARLVVPMEMIAWRRAHDRSRQEVTLHLGLGERVESLEVEARELWGGQESFRLRLAPDERRRVADGTGIAMRLRTELGVPHPAVDLTLELATWPSGLWLLGLEVRTEAEGGWRRPTNVRGDSFGTLVDLEPEGARAGGLDASPVETVFASFERLHAELQRCFALPCWQGDVDALARLWRRLARGLAAHPAGPPWRDLLPLAFAEPPFDASPSWLPLCSLWDEFVEVMAQPAPVYAALRGELRGDAKVVAEMAAIAEAGGLARYQHARDRLHLVFLQRFSTFAMAASAKGALELAGFDWKSYRHDILKAIEAGPPAWSAEDGLLSPAHHAAAAEALVHRYHALTVGDANAERVQGSSTLAAAARRWLERRGRQALRPLLARDQADGGALAIVPAAIEADDAYLGAALHTLSATALACRLEPRAPGTLLRSYLVELDAAGGDRARTTGAIHFLTTAGQESFALYLLLWEAILVTEPACRT